MDNNNDISRVAIILAFFMVLLITSPINSTDISSTQLKDIDNEIDYAFLAYTDHSPIAIDGDDDFNDTAQLSGWSGNGTASNPFIIENLRIHTGGTSTSRISISNTRAYFIISNCSLAGATASGAGVYLYNVTNGDINNNICFNNVYGVDIRYSQDCLVFSNTFVSNNAGISLFQSSSSNEIIQNNCSSNSNAGIFVSMSTHNLIHNNTCTGNGNDGITINSAADNTVTDNTCGNNNFDIHIQDSSESNNITHNTCSGGSQRGIFVSLSSYNRIENNTCIGNDEGIYLGGSATYNDVINNTAISNNEYGIHLLTSSYNSLTSNTCWNNTDWGIYLDQSDYNNLTSNSCSNSTYDIYLTSADHNRLNDNRVFYGGYGLYLGFSTLNTINSNEFYSNINYGIELANSNSNNITYNDSHNNGYGIYSLAASSNNIQWNIFANNSANADDSMGTNDFEYNYYSNYAGTDIDQNGIGDTPHYFLGNNDPHPLIYLPTNPTWEKVPENQFITDLDILFYHLNVTCPSPLSWAINNTYDFAVFDNGTIRSKDTLAIGEYGLIVNVTSIYNYSLVEEFSVFVQPWDMDPPAWVVEPENQFVEFGSHLDYDLDVTDDSGISYWWINSTDFAINGNGEIRSIVPLAIGVYGLEIFVNDTYNNILSTIISVTVEDTTPPSWLTPPENRILGYGHIFSYDLDADDLSGIDSWWINNSLFTIDSNGLIENNTILDVGVYWIQVFVNDSIGNLLNANISVTVYDTISPSWIDLQTSHYFDYGEAIQIEVEATDDQGIHHYWLNDTEYFTFDGSTIRNSTILDSGTYQLLIRAFDAAGNYCEETIVVTVGEELITSTTSTTTTTTDTTTVTTTSPQTNTTGTTDEGLDPMIILALGGGVFMVLIICIILRRK